MEINTINITITPDELEMLGTALELSIKDQTEMMERDSFDMLVTEEVDLLRNFVRAGYSIYLNGGKSLRDGRMCHDVDEFVDHLYREKANS